MISKRHKSFILTPLILLPTLSAQEPAEDEQSIEEIIRTLASPDAKIRCKAQAAFDPLIGEITTAELKSIVIEILENDDPETTQKLAAFIEQAFIEQNYQKELGYLGIFISIGTYLREGVEVKVVKASKITPGSPAAKHGLKDGDLITAIDGVFIGGPNCDKQLQDIIALKGAGNSCEFTIHRDGKSFTQNITLSSRRKGIPPGSRDELRLPTKAEKNQAFQKWLRKQPALYEKSKQSNSTFQPELDTQVQKMIRIRPSRRR